MLTTTCERIYDAEYETPTRQHSATEFMYDVHTWTYLLRGLCFAWLHPLQRSVIETERASLKARRERRVFARDPVCRNFQYRMKYLLRVSAAPCTSLSAKSNSCRIRQCIFRNFIAHPFRVHRCCDFDLDGVHENSAFPHRQHLVGFTVLTRIIRTAS